MTTKASPSSKTKSADSKRLDKLESLLVMLADKVDAIVDKKPDVLPRVEKPDVAMAAMHEARVGEEPSRRADTVDRKHPQVGKTFKGGDFITIKPSCPLYKEYMVVYDDSNRPHPVADEAICDSCGTSYPPRATKCRTKDCKGTPIRTEVPDNAMPAVGMIRKALYVKKRGTLKGQWKYSVWFDGYGTKDAGGEGLMESEMELCPVKN